MSGRKRAFVPIMLILLSFAAFPSFAQERQKVILDTDMVQLFDDGVAMVMLAKAPNIELLGVTVVAGNTWVPEGVAHGLRQLELIGREEVPLAAGMRFPLRAQRHELLATENALFGEPSYVGAFSRPEPESFLGVSAEQEPFGGYPQIKPIAQHGVDFLIEQIRANPGEVTVLAIGPLTNLATAIRKDPQIVPMIRQVIYMGGAFDTPGNTTPAAEFNWWFDPEAAKISVRAPFRDQLVVGLDVTEKYHFTKAVYDRIVAVDNPYTQVFRAEFEQQFQQDPNYQRLVWDTIAAAVCIDQSLITEEETRGLDVDDQYGLNYGRSMGYAENPPQGTQQGRILFTIDEARFWDLLVRLVTAPAAS